MSLPARSGIDSTAGLTSARGWASPSRVRGDTIVASRASWDLCQRGRPFATTSMRRASATGTSTFMSASRTLRATLAPASRQTRATVSSSGRARVGRTPEVAQAARWSPEGSSCPRQLHLRGASGRGSRKRRSRRTRNKALGMVTSSRGPAWDSSSAREAGVRSERCVWVLTPNVRWYCPGKA